MIRTKIVCTIGPASRDPAMIERLITAGMNVARLNFSHGTQEYHAQNIAVIRAAAQKLGRPVAILADLQGPKLRVGEMPEGGLIIEEGERVLLTVEDTPGMRSPASGAQARIPVQYAGLPQDVKVGETILLDDGLLELRVLEILGDREILCEVVTGGLLHSRKGLNLPGTMLSLPSITEKDWADLDFMIDHGIDWVALSFVRTPTEVQTLKDHIARRGSPLKVVAKIEKPQALECIESIIDTADAIMVARGDLGIEIPPERVPGVQKRLIRAANRAGKPVITATQMLDSMIRNPRPTRAEASDVANAILDGTDAIMLSGETAAGSYPLESVRTMVRIAEEAEAVMRQTNEPWRPPAHVPPIYNDVTDAVALASCEVAFDVQAVAIITATSSGKTACSVARYRPFTPIIAVTPDPVVQRQLMLTWGVIPLLGERADSTDLLLRLSMEMATAAGLIGEGDRVVLTAGVANNMPGTTNLMTVEEVKIGG